MSETYYRVVCNQHDQPVVLVDVTCDPDQEAWQRYRDEQQRWDRHNSGEEPIPVSGDRYRRPHPRDFRPYMSPHTSRQVSVNPHEAIFVPELVDRSAPDDMNEYMEAFFNGQRFHDGYVRVLDYEIGDTENADGHEIRIGCALCAKVRGKSLLAFASADTLAMVLDRIGASLETVSMPVIDQRDNKPTGEIVEVRMVTLYELRKELGDNPHG
jgi:hypothetical protein